MALEVGIHLPQFGRASVPKAIQLAAVAAESLGFAHLWASDHLVRPRGQDYPTAFLCDPLQSLAFAAAVTDRVLLGTSVLVGPQYASPLALANTLASLDHLSDGRFVLGIGVGWSEAEYTALGAPFDHRGARLDEILDLFEIVWRDDPATFRGRFYPSFEELRLLPKPARPIPIWIGGMSDAALERAVARGDGYHSQPHPIDEMAALVARLRARRPEPAYRITMRFDWEVASTEATEVADQLRAYEEIGVQGFHVAPVRGDLEDWLRNQELLAKAAGLC